MKELGYPLTTSHFGSVTHLLPYGGDRYLLTMNYSTGISSTGYAFLALINGDGTMAWSVKLDYDSVGALNVHEATLQDSSIYLVDP